MQLTALKENQEKVWANIALKKNSYRCPECFQKVRVRSGPHRRAHFFHLANNASCRQTSKTLPHIETQKYILDQLPLGEGDLEVAFPSIHRIADVVWEKKKLIFEVQCSSITREEVSQRNLDYESLNYRVIWILHEKKFNRRHLSSAEAFLIDKEHYFTSIDSQGKGFIYDQFRLIEKALRLFKGPSLPIALDAPFDLGVYETVAQELPEVIRIRTKTRKIGFQGDLFEKILNSSYAEQRALSSSFSFKEKRIPLLTKIKTLYLEILGAYLEKNTSKQKK